ncbi:MAG TPA: carboxypeptidase-like regulatory domain-containing protein, partial [Bryobacteraceae bacterium]|nr:carboxypeptidase-like regulatory domain-containing protein [Bryobacteraceae bacterium]
MKAGVALMALLAVMPVTVLGAEYRLLGTIRGEVRNPAGTTQMGAVVSLYNRYERLIEKALTDASGRFEFRALAPDQYAVRVNLSTYVPANRTNIAVRAGMESFLSIELATIFSSIELVYTAPEMGSPLLTEDWKWVLRSSGVTRPVLRALPGLDVQFPGLPPRAKRSGFELTRGLMRVSAGSEGSSSVLGHEPDLGTAFALATTVFGGNELRVLGNLGYASSMGVPVTAFRTSYSGLSSPDVELTVRQVSMRHAASQRLLDGPGGAEAPMLRTMSAKVLDQQQITEEVSLEYGALLEAVAFLDRMTMFSPFARLTTDLG